MNLTRAIIFFLLLLASLGTASGTARAQALIDPKNYKLPVSNLMPVVPKELLKDLASTEPLSNDIANALYDQCMSKIPDRFSSEGHKYYCSCSSAATQGNLTVGELTDIQDEKNRTIRNKSFEKYIRNVMYPCMDVPIDDMEYATCTMNRSNDWRIRYPIAYCKCVTSLVKDHFKKFGETEMMIGWGTYGAKQGDPIAAAWNTTEFQTARENARNQCVGTYIDQEVTKRVPQ